MRQLKPLLLIVVIVFAAIMGGRYVGTPSVPAVNVSTTDQRSAGTDRRDAAAALPEFLPAEAADTMARITRGGPFEHRQDGGVFGNREGLLPPKPRGYYREYTVATPGLDHRGARRIVTGGTPPVVWYYTHDHYRSFRRFEVTP